MKVVRAGDDVAGFVREFRGVLSKLVKPKPMRREDLRWHTEEGDKPPKDGIEVGWFMPEGLKKNKGILPDIAFRFLTTDEPPFECEVKISPHMVFDDDVAAAKEYIEIKIMELGCQLHEMRRARDNAMKPSILTTEAVH